MTPVFQNDLVTLYHGAMEDVIPHLAASGQKFDAIIADGPYCSGGTGARERTGKTPSQKYVMHGVTAQRADFSGDQRDQRTFLLWVSLWARLLVSVARAPCYLVSFIDKRNLPTMTDAIQLGGWRWSDLLPWDKGVGSCRPQKGWFRGSQCEYAVVGQLGTRGMEQTRDGPCLEGVLRAGRAKDETALHMHAKPVQILKQLLGPLTPCEPGSRVVLDPFAGSGSTAVAAMALGIRCVLIETEAANIEIITRRLKTHEAHRELFPQTLTLPQHEPL